MASRIISSALILLVFLARVFDADLTTQSVVTSANVVVSEDTDDSDEGSMTKRAPKGDDIFDDVDPKTLAALLLEALNRTRVESRREEEEEEEAGGQRDRDGRQKLELLMAAQGQQEAEERKKAEEEEERMTERVSSRTSSQTLHVQTQQPPAAAEPDQGGAAAEEEQLNPEELRSLETMMKEFPRLDTAVKRGGDSEPSQRESRGYSSFNDIIPLGKGSFSEKKLKWQEETQKALSMPAFRGGNFMDDFEGNNAATVAQPKQSEQMESDDPEDEEEEEDEVLSPEEEEARAKAEQEEMRRQAAEVQKAKMEEEKLADIASDMLLRYMVKQNGGSSRKYADTAADKRSEEEQEDDDIDPQTIDKLIEISSKLHLPADDVVDIISDVEKKKKKDMTPELLTHWQRPQPTSADSFTKSNIYPVSKQPSPAVHLLKSWFQEPSRSKTFWGNPADRLLWSKPLKSIKQEAWLQKPRPVWTHYPSFYQRKPHQDYYPIYFPPPRPTFRYYVPKPALAFNTLLQRSQDGAYSFLPKQRYLNWMPPRLRKPPAALYPRRPFSFYPQSAPKPAVPLYQSAPRGHLDKYIEQLLLNRPQD
uniref:neurosecretory protein VGF n=1 Tax=Doryrhamphus excisus TaxID=161450 RepID=UPI0025AE2CC3|nr:neurosecretory protein VGF [Doryrhamphus excisus]